MSAITVESKKLGAEIRHSQFPSVQLDEERDALLTIKRGELSWPDVNAWRQRQHKEFDEAFASSRLPERCPSRDVCFENRGPLAPLGLRFARGDSGRLIIEG